jgi:hypothetical protein
LQEIDFLQVPAFAREQLQSRMRAQLLFTLSMMAELFRILEDSSKGGIETVSVKGPLVSCWRMAIRRCAVLWTSI